MLSRVIAKNVGDVFLRHSVDRDRCYQTYYHAPSRLATTKDLTICKGSTKYYFYVSKIILLAFYAYYTEIKLGIRYSVLVTLKFDFLNIRVLDISYFVGQHYHQV